jgi:hypothetical protein
MASLVLDLQSAAMDRGTTVSDLLRRVKVVAAKLQLNEVSEWVDHELNGYPEDDEKIPLYREIRGEVRGLNPLLGWRPVHGDERILAIAGTMKTRQSASELETLITDLKDGSSLSFGVPEAFRKNVDTTAGVPPTDVRVFVQKGQIVAVLDAIRTRVLDWALDLEKQGIMGEKMSFSNEEKERAVTSSVVNHFHVQSLTMVGTNLGAMSDSATIKTHYEGSFVSTVETAISEVGKNLSHLPPTEREDVEAQIDSIRDELKSAAPRPNRVKSSLQAILRVVKSLADWTGKAVVESALETGIHQLMPPS